MTPIPKQEKIRILLKMCGPRLAYRFDMFGYQLLSRTEKGRILKALQDLFDYNQFAFHSDKVSAYWEELAKYSQYQIPK